MKLMKKRKKSKKKHKTYVFSFLFSKPRKNKFVNWIVRNKYYLLMAFIFFVFLISLLLYFSYSKHEKNNINNSLYKISPKHFHIKNSFNGVSDFYELNISSIKNATLDVNIKKDQHIRIGELIIYAIKNSSFVLIFNSFNNSISNAFLVLKHGVLAISDPYDFAIILMDNFVKPDYKIIIKGFANIMKLKDIMIVSLIDSTDYYVLKNNKYVKFKADQVLSISDGIDGTKLNAFNYKDASLYNMYDSLLKLSKLYLNKNLESFLRLHGLNLMLNSSKPINYTIFLYTNFLRRIITCVLYYKRTQSFDLLFTQMLQNFKQSFEEILIEKNKNASNQIIYKIDYDYLCKILFNEFLFFSKLYAQKYFKQFDNSNTQHLSESFLQFNKTFNLLLELCKINKTLFFEEIKKQNHNLDSDFLMFCKNQSNIICDLIQMNVEDLIKLNQYLYLRSGFVWA